MSLLSYLVPLAIVVWVAFEARRNLAVLVVLPLLIIFGRSVYIDTFVNGLFVRGLQLMPVDLVLIGLLIVLLVAREVRPRVKQAVIGSESWPILAVLGVVGLAMLATVLSGHAPFQVIHSGIRLGAPAIGFFIWLDYLRRFTAEEVESLLRFLVTLTAVLMIPYILQAIGFHTYPYSPYGSVSSASGVAASASDRTLVRDFLTFPFWAPVALACLAARPQATKRWIAEMSLVSVGFAVTFTRSLIIAAVAAVLFGTINFALNKSWSRRRVMGMSALAVTAVLAVVILQSESPLVGRELGSRFGELTTSGLSSTNVAGRTNLFERTLSQVSGAGNAALGMGVYSYGSIDPAWGLHLGSFGFADSMWPVLMLYLGLAGVVAYGAMLAVGLLSAARRVRVERKTGAAWGIIALLVLVQWTMATFASDGLLHLGAVAGFAFALLVVSKYDLWYQGVRELANEEVSRADAATIVASPAVREGHEG